LLADDRQTGGTDTHIGLPTTLRNAPHGGDAVIVRAFRVLIADNHFRCDEECGCDLDLAVPTAPNVPETLSAFELEQLAAFETTDRQQPRHLSRLRSGTIARRTNRRRGATHRSRPTRHFAGTVDAAGACTRSV